MGAQSAFVTGEGYLSTGRNPSSDTDFVRATFSHKGRREGSAGFAGTTANGERRSIRQLAFMPEKRLCYGHDG